MEWDFGKFTFGSPIGDNPRATRIWQLFVKKVALKIPMLEEGPSIGNLVIKKKSFVRAVALEILTLEEEAYGTW